LIQECYYIPEDALELKFRAFRILTGSSRERGW